MAKSGAVWGMTEPAGRRAAGTHLASCLVFGVHYMPIFAFLRKTETAEAEVQKQSVGMLVKDRDGCQFAVHSGCRGRRNLR